MRIRKSWAIAFAVAASLLSGCSPTSTAPQTGDVRSASSTRSVPSVLAPWLLSRRFAPHLPPVLHSGANPNGAPPVITSAQFFHDDLSIYGVSSPAIPDAKTITLTFLENITTGVSAPQGTTATLSGDWYVANSGASNVLVFHYNGSTFVETKTLDDSGNVPGDVDTNAKESLVAVSNVQTSSSGPPSISLYAHGSTTPTGHLSAPDATVGVGVALDAKGNCFWSYEASSVAKIVEFPACKGAPVDVPESLAYPGGLAFDRSGNLYYADPSAAKVYKCVGISSSCNPLAQTFVAPVFLNFDRRWKHVWVADFGSATIYGIDAKSGRTISTTAAVGGASDPPLGIAPIPGSKY